MINNKNDILTTQTLDNKEAYEIMARDIDKEEEKFNLLISACADKLFQNKIFIIDNKEILSTTLGKDFFNIRFNELQDSEDFNNAKIKIKTLEYKANNLEGFCVAFPKTVKNCSGEVNVEIVTSLSDFIKKVISFKKKSGHKTFYRGHGDWQFELVPGIYREQNKAILSNESNYIKNIIASHPKFFTNSKSALDFLSVLQHHSFPTRLLDFSENPLIALFMACDSDNEKHADTIRIEVSDKSFKFYDSDTVSVLANLAFTDNDFSVQDFKCEEIVQQLDNEEYYEKLIKPFNKRTDIKKLVHLIRNEKPFFKPEIDIKHLEDSIIFVKPKQDFDRITHQNGLFALFGINKNKKIVPEIEFMDNPCHITHLIIPAECKRIIKEELACINISEATVYCDMDHITKHYIKMSQTHKVQNDEDINF